MVAKSGDFNACLSACLVNGVAGIDLDRLSVDINIKLLTHLLRRSEHSLHVVDKSGLCGGDL